MKGLKTKVAFSAVFGADGPVAKDLRNEGFEVDIIPELRSKIHFTKDLQATIALLGLVKKRGPDIIHCHSTKAGLIGRIVASRLKLPCIFTVHGWGWRGLNIVTSLAGFLTEWMLARTTNARYIYVSKSVCQVAEKYLRIPSKNGRVIYNGASAVPRSKHSEKTSMQIIMCSRVSPAKDHKSLIMAFEMTNVSARLVLCGGGTEGEKFRALAKKWAPSRFEDISFLGERSDVRELIASSDVLAQISHFEALPLSIIEAMGSSLPVIATNVGGVAELIDHEKNGILVNRGNIAEIAEAIQRLSDITFRENLADKASTKHQSVFSEQTMLRETHRYYQFVNAESHWPEAQVLANAEPDERLVTKVKNK
jgi:glycosyltransferase involved in cell wall biosynthesis